MLYTFDKNTYFVIPKDDPKDKIGIEIGDSKQPDFKPQVKIMRWDNEVNFSLRAQEDPSAKVEIQEDRIKYVASKYEVHFFDKPDASENGGFEFEWTLREKPASNILTVTIQTKGLDFFYQAPLSQEQIDKGFVRPENVVGSYAVYHKIKGRMNDSAGMDYKVGKAFHIYRPKIIDLNGVETWGELNIDEVNGFLTVIIDQNWLEGAAYPVTVDPTFGYTSLGSTGSLSVAANVFGTIVNRMHGQAYNLPEAGTLDKITIGWRKFIGAGNESVDLFAAIYREDSAGANSHDKVASVEKLDQTVSSTASWIDFTAASEPLSADDYILAGLGDGADITTGGNHQITIPVDTSQPERRDYDENTSGSGGYATRKSEEPWTQVDSLSTAAYSIYATYTVAVPPGPTPASPYLLPDKKLPTGYHCFMSNFVKNMLAGYPPLKLPDGTRW